MVQRDLNPQRVDYLIANYDEHQIGQLRVSHRNGDYWIIDGQHRAAATLLKFGDSTEIQCWVYEGLDEKAEAEMFLRFNDQLNVGALDKFEIAVQAERPVETQVNAIVKRKGLHISRNSNPGAIKAVSTLKQIYTQEGASVTDRTLEVLNQSFGDAGLSAAMLAGMGLFVGRYSGEIDIERLVSKLSTVRGGVNGVLGKAEILRRQTNLPKKQCTAAAITELYNSGRGGKKLAPWFK